MLIAEDIALNRELVRLMLEPEGYQVDEVANGSEALLAIQTMVYDVVLMDVQMPVFDGVEATRAVRALGGRYADLPIIGFSAYVAPNEIKRFLEAGMSGHLAKPFRLAALCETIARWSGSQINNPGPGALRDSNRSRPAAGDQARS